MNVCGEFFVKEGYRCAMNGTRIFDVDKRTEPRFEYIKSVKVEEPEDDYGWVWERLVETPSGCWLWTGKHSERGFPIVGNIPAGRNRFDRYVQRITWKLIKGKKVLFGRIEQRCGRIGCANPSHFSIIY